MKTHKAWLVTLVPGGTWTASASAVEVMVTIESRTPTNGLYLTPFWVGFHDGTFDLFDPGVALTPGGGLEVVAEDGDTSVLSAEFAAGPAGGVDGTIIAPDGFPGAPVLDPHESASAIFDLDPVANRYFSFASMVIPSNDAFIGNANSRRFQLFDEDGEFTGPIRVLVRGSMVWDAGTEANTEMQAAFFNQTANNTGVTTADPVLLHPGFINSFENPGGTSIILGGTSVAPPGIFFGRRAADFTRPRYQMVRITIDLVDEDDDDDDDDHGDKDDDDE